MHLLQLAFSRTCRLNVSPAVQAKLLRAIENKKIYRLGSSRGHDLDIRILAATNQDLAETTLQNRFRGDLYYRPNVVRIEVPPLRERVEDLPALVQHSRIVFVTNLLVQGKSRFSSRILQETLIVIGWPNTSGPFRCDG